LARTGIRVIGNNGSRRSKMEFCKRKKILIITDVFKKIAGSERNIMQLLRGMDQRRFEVYVACFYSGEVAQVMRAERFQVHDLRLGGIYSFSGLKNIILLSKLIREEKIDLILTYHEGSDFLGLVLSKLCAIPIISNRRDMGFKTRFPHQVTYRLFGRCFDGVITVSDAVKKEVIHRGWFKERKVWSIHNGINAGEYGNHVNRDSIKRSMGIKANTLVVGLIANIKKIKGIRYFVHAASLISAENSGVEFVIIGYDLNETGYSMKDMKLLADRMNIADKIHFLGGRKDIGELISTFDVAVISSLSEGFSNVLLEYMASGRPVVATDVGGNREAVIHGETGLLVPSENADQLAEAIKVFLDHKDLALTYGLAGRKRVEKEFSLQRMIEKYESIFERVALRN
jgi:glycosyltransferase involved in cell wall biosynthesis